MYIMNPAAGQRRKDATMTIQSFYPVICTDRIAESKAFYLERFDFTVTFEADWYVSLRSSRHPSVELALLDYHHPSLPEPYRKPARGVLLNIEVPDADSEYRRLKAAGVPIRLDLRSEAWGQRHFITEDPNGLLIDVIQTIAPDETYAEQYR